MRGEVARYQALLTRTPTWWVCAMVDLFDFRAVNRMLGHDVGDDVLREVARRLAALPEHHVFRVSGGMFVLLWPSDGSERSRELRRAVNVVRTAPIAVTQPVLVSDIDSSLAACGVRRLGWRCRVG
jgi:diguanylate cyclase (GGDEF)-like protein